MEDGELESARVAAAARELRRVLRPGAPVLIRNALPGRCDRDIRVRYFPETAYSIDTYPSVEHVGAVFAAAGFPTATVTSLPQHSAPTLAAYAATLHRDSDSKLRALTDEQYRRGLDRLLTDAATRPHEPAVSWMDLLVLR